MGQPIEIKNSDDLLLELISVSSSLNMPIIDSDLDQDIINNKSNDQKFISDLKWGNHALEHLNNIFKFLSNNSIITEKEKK